MESQKSPTTLLLIALFKLLKGVLLLVVAISAFRLIHKDVSEVVMHWVEKLHFDPDGKVIHRIIEKSFGIEPKHLKEIGFGSFFYSALLLTEGVGLLLKKRWAEYFTVITTAVFIPLEIYEIFHRFRWSKIWILAVNVAIVWYLVERIKKGRPETAGRP